jgi:cardiolipin synthase (CMP-forming)
MTTANKITVVRILMIPAFVTMAIYYGQSIQRGAPLEWQRYAAIIIFLVAAISDGLDGYVARHYNRRSAIFPTTEPSEARTGKDGRAPSMSPQPRSGKGVKPNQIIS